MRRSMLIFGAALCVVLLAFAVAHVLAIRGLQAENRRLRQELTAKQGEAAAARTAEHEALTALIGEHRAEERDRHLDALQVIRLEGVQIRTTVKERCP